MRNAWILFLLCLCGKRKPCKKIYYWIGLGASKQQAKIYEEFTRIYDNKCIVHIQARIHTSFHRFMEMGQIFQNKYIFNKKNFQVEIWKMVSTPWHFQLENHLSLSSVGYTVFTCESERNASAFGWLNAEHHVTDEIDKTRLAHIHYNMEIDLDK